LVVDLSEEELAWRAMLLWLNSEVEDHKSYE
jgi:hypothetical protein